MNARSGFMKALDLPTQMKRMQRLVALCFELTRQFLRVLRA